MNTDLSSYDNSWYHPGSSVKRLCWYSINLLIFKSSFFPFYKLKVFLLHLFGAKTGKNILIKPNVNIKYPWFLEIGDNVWIGENVWIDNLGRVSIGNNVCLSQKSMLLSGNHDYTKSTFDLIVKDIIIEDGVWIAAGAIVCGGVICKNHSVLSVGSVATQSLEPNTIYAGNPAIKLRERKSQANF
ncbi:MAG: WcaF family extracellular polysaccharide biosynthesis acetyltransferase [Bacteroidota bacterium]|nr:WcaF family extracellular polysaccharide biosynthesis acetyltransferase [Bacteroidota bacterium]